MEELAAGRSRRAWGGRWVDHHLLIAKVRIKIAKVKKGKSVAECVLRSASCETLRRGTCSSWRCTTDSSVCRRWRRKNLRWMTSRDRSSRVMWKPVRRCWDKQNQTKRSGSVRRPGRQLSNERKRKMR